jgi:nitroreductase
MELETAIRRRHSIRRYSVKEVAWKHLIAILDSARFAPFAGNICSLRIVLVTDKDKIQQLAEATSQHFLATAPALIVVCSDVKLVMMAYGKRAFMYSRQQVGAAIQNMLLKVTELGLASCWIGAFDDKSVRDILAIPDEVEIEAILPVAHKAWTREAKRKHADLKDILFFNRYGNKKR